MKRCRCCLTADSESFFYIFEEHKSGSTYADSIRFLGEVQIGHNDGLSQHICLNCYDELHQIYEFCLKVRQADVVLRKEQEATKNQVQENKVETIKLLDNEFFAPMDDNGMQVCVMEEIIEAENGTENILIVEEIHDMEEINVVEEISDSVRDQKEKFGDRDENLLEDLAVVAATHENLHTDKDGLSIDCYLPEDENDADYQILFDPNDATNLKNLKWKCGECKLILRGDVSYEGHMNIHKQCRPHTCDQCKAMYRCRAALKQHRDIKHSSPVDNTKITKKIILCLVCQKTFYSEITFYLHQAIVHCQGDKCPFDCSDSNDSNLKQHLEYTHEKEIISATETVCPDYLNMAMAYQCFRCSKTFGKQNMLQDHFKLCHTMEKEELQYDNIKSESIIEIVKVDECDVSVECNVCQKRLLRRNLNKHMKLHKSKEGSSNGLDNASSYLCSFCPREFKNSKSLHQHEKIHHGESSDIVYVCADCDRQYASQYLLETHRKQAHKERDNICEICGNAFKLRNQLVNHMKLHLEKNIPCPQCDKKYARQFDLNVHLRSHTGEQPYACHLCEKRFAIKVRLTYHLQKHYGIKHNCKECGAEFNSKQKLKAHSFKHTGMPYRCKMCDYHGFATRNTFKRHLTRVHHTSISEEALNEMFRENTGKSVSIKQIAEQDLIVTVSEDDHLDDIEVLGK